MNTSKKSRNEGMAENLIAQVKKIFRNSNEKSIGTRKKYLQSTKKFCRFLAQEYRLNKFQNVKEKHVIRYVEYLKERGYANIQTELSGIRFFVERAGCKNAFPANSQLALEKRQIGKLDRAWSADEIKAAIALATEMGRTDVIIAIKCASTFGMRIEEVVKCQVNHIKNAVENGELYIKGKGGQIRHLPLKTSLQREFANNLADYAKANGKRGTDLILVDRVKGSVAEKKNPFRAGSQIIGMNLKMRAERPLRIIKNWKPRPAKKAQSEKSGTLRSMD